jgi:hypothetical protein
VSRAIGNRSFPRHMTTGCLCKQNEAGSHSRGRGREAVRFTLPPPPPDPHPHPPMCGKGLSQGARRRSSLPPTRLRARARRQTRYASNPFYRHGGVENAGNFSYLPYRMNTAFPTPLPLWACRPRPQRRSIIFFLFRRLSLRTSAVKSLRYAPSLLHLVPACW